MTTTDPHPHLVDRPTTATATETDTSNVEETDLAHPCADQEAAPHRSHVTGANPGPSIVVPPDPTVRYRRPDAMTLT